MQLVAWALYSIIIITYLASAGFIVFHILRYSLCRTNAIFGISFFLTVFILLFLINLSLFSNLPLDELIKSEMLFHQSSGF